MEDVQPGSGGEARQLFFDRQLSIKDLSTSKQFGLMHLLPGLPVHAPERSWAQQL